LSDGAKAGIAIGVIVFVILLIVLVVFAFKRGKVRFQSSYTTCYVIWSQARRDDFELPENAQLSGPHAFDVEDK
jgi:predicted RND superfamily exporter protein